VSGSIEGLDSEWWQDGHVIKSVLLSRAHAPGNAFVFLMAGAATDYTEIASLRQTTRSWKATLGLPLISTPQVLVIGWLIQRLSS
jgi:hypothetical protein